MFGESINSNEFGFATFDCKSHFLDGNALARKWFPELNDLEIDRLIPSYNTDFLKQINSWISGNDDETIHLFYRGEQIIAAKKIIIPIRKTNIFIAFSFTMTQSNKNTYSSLKIKIISSIRILHQKIKQLSYFRMILSSAWQV